MRKPKSDWTDLFLAFRMILEPRKLWLAFKGIVLSIVLVGVLLIAFAALSQALGLRGGFALPALTVQGTPRTVSVDAPAADVWDALWHVRLGDAIDGTYAFTTELVAAAATDVESLVAALGRSAADPAAAFWSADALIHLLLVAFPAALVLLFVWSYYGPAIMRLAAVEYALGEQIELKSAAAYTWRKHQSFYGSPLGLIAAILLVTAAINVLGLAAWNVLLLGIACVGLIGVVVAASLARDRMCSLAWGLGAGLVGLLVLAAVLALVNRLGWRIPYVGELIVGVLSPLAIAGGFVVAIMGIWLVFGLPMMAGTVATSDTGTFDAWSRSFHYLFVHPWRYAFYLLVAAVHGAVCLGFVYAVRTVTEWATLLPLSVGPLMASDRASEPVLRFFIAVDRLMLDMIFLSFVATYIFTALAIVYLLMRWRADGTPISEVHLERRDGERLRVEPAIATNRHE